MQEAHSNKHPNDFDDEIDLRELFYVLLEGKWIIFSVTAFASMRRSIAVPQEDATDQQWLPSTSTWSWL